MQGCRDAEIAAAILCEDISNPIRSRIAARIPTAAIPTTRDNT
jgi:hypothetical protein